MKIEKITTKAHCNTCGPGKSHEILHSEKTKWVSDEDQIFGGDTYETLKCGGCAEVKLRHRSWFSENDDDDITYFPALLFRRKPEWFNELRRLKKDEKFVLRLLKEIYVALQYDLPALALMGVRALLERVMISKTGDQGTFMENITEFEKIGHVSHLQRARLATILEAGHATMHRGYEPEKNDVITALDLTEHIVQTVYLHDAKINELKERVPPRPPRPPKKKAAPSI